MRYQIIDPATNRLIRSFDDDSDAAVHAAVDRAHAAFGVWRSTPLAARTALLSRVAQLYRQNAAQLAATITQEMGKTAAEALGEIDIVADIYDYYATHAARLNEDEVVQVAQGTASIRKDPVGVLLGIMPWNYPHYQVARFAAPNLALGNTIVLKHAPSCPRSAELISELLREAGIPDGAYENVRASESQIAGLIARAEVQGVSLTGSERAGSAVGAITGRAMKKLVLELGGSDPFIVLPDADLESAAEAAAVGRMGNAGQACTASKRFFVHGAVYDEFVRRFVDRVAAIVVGDPSNEDTTMGPLSSESAAQRVVEQIDDALEHGAEALVGGARIDRPGAFVAPTVLVGVTPAARAYREEIFGPVAVVHRVETVDDAVELANDSPYGLGAVVFGADESVVRDVSARLDVGMVHVNGASLTQADLPFGGVKASGFGRELGDSGMSEFVNRKLVRIHLAQP